MSPQAQDDRVESGVRNPISDTSSGVDGAGSAGGSHTARKESGSPSVWLSGWFTGKDYLPPPPIVDEKALTEEEKELLLTKPTFVSPQGKCYRKEALPAIAHAKPVGTLALIMRVHAVLTLISFVFLLAAIPTHWFKYEDNWWSLWKFKNGATGATSTPYASYCSSEKQFYQTIAASAIIACIFSFFSLASSVAKLLGKGSYNMVLFFGFLAFAWSLTADALAFRLYRRWRCDQPILSDFAKVGPALVLCTIAWVLLCIAFLFVIVGTKLNIYGLSRNPRIVGSYVTLLYVAALVFMCIACASTTWSRSFSNSMRVDVSYWHTEVSYTNAPATTYYGYAAYRCQAYSKRIKASVSFLILACTAAFFSVMFGIGAVKKPGLSMAVNVAGILSWVFLSISWITAVVIFHRKSCTGDVSLSSFANFPGVPSGIEEGLTSFPGYHLREGVVLSIIAWLMMAVAVVLNFLF